MGPPRRCLHSQATPPPHPTDISPVCPGLRLFPGDLLALGHFSLAELIGVGGPCNSFLGCVYSPVTPGVVAPGQVLGRRLPLPVCTLPTSAPFPEKGPEAGQKAVSRLPSRWCPAAGQGLGQAGFQEARPQRPPRGGGPLYCLYSLQGVRSVLH